MKNNKIKIFFIVMAVITFITTISGIFTKGKSIERILFGDSNDTYMDFYNSLVYRKEPYQNKVIYPPLTNVVYYVISEFIPRKTFSQGSFSIRSSQMGRFIGGLYLALSYIIFLYAILKLKKGKLEEQFIFAILLILSTPFIYQLERGNIIFITCTFIMLYLHAYNSQTLYKKHLAFICLSIAAAFKIYPAIFGFLLIKEKRWKDAGICLLYGISIFVLPVIFLGGFSSLSLFINNLLTASKELSAAHPLRIQLSISNFCNIIAKYAKIEKIPCLNTTVTVLVLISGILIILLADYKEKWKTIAVSTSLMITIPNFSFIYAMIFISIPLIFFLDEENMKDDYFFLTLYIFMLAPFPVRFSGYVESLALFIMMAMLWFEGLKLIWAKYKNKFMLAHN